MENIFSHCYIDEKDPNTIRLNQQLDRATFLEIKKQLSFVGKWSRSKVGFECEFNPANYLLRLQSGEADLKQKLNYFPTPPLLSELLVLESGIRYENNNKKVLEPSAGRGALIQEIKDVTYDYETEIHAVEFSDLNAEFIRDKHPDIDLFIGDFLQYDKERDFDFIIGNPPFRYKDEVDEKQKHDIDHIYHAYNLLKPNKGRLAFITSQAWRNNSQKKFKAFKGFVDDLNEKGYVCWYPGIIEHYGDDYKFPDTNIDVDIIVIDHHSEVKTPCV